MAQAVLERVLNDLSALEAEELEEVQQAVNDRLTPPQRDPKEQAFLESLLATGLISEIKPRARPRPNRAPAVPIQGKPLSETIIEDRR